MQILRDPDFLKLCTDYPRPRRTFLVATGVTDTVESEWLIKGGVGKEYKPEDYLQLFIGFVEDHREDIDAIQVLLSRPSDWSPETLSQLRDKLAIAPEHFTVTNLQRAFHATHHKALVDIISMVKRAVIAESSLLTAEERVDAAIRRVRAGREFTQEQDQWLDYIHQHLVQNLSIEKEDFDLIPVLSSRGGWGRANRVFDGKLPDLLAELNRELVAA